MPPCLQAQHRPSDQVRVTWRFDAPDSTTMLTPRRSSSLAASTQLRCLHDDFDAALGRPPSSWHSMVVEQLVAGARPVLEPFARFQPLAAVQDVIPAALASSGLCYDDRLPCHLLGDLAGNVVVQ